jgi:hypothetical protein
VPHLPGSPQALPSDFAGRVIPFPAREAPLAAADLPFQPAARPATAQKVRVRSRVIRDVVVLEVAGRLADVVEDLDQAIQEALAGGPRGVACDLSTVLEGAQPVDIGVLATAGRHVRDWPGIPVAVACPDPRVREALAAHPLGGHLIVASSLFSAISAVLACPALAVESLRLAPHPTAPRASREFLTRTLLDWRLGRVVPFACRLASELVAGSSVDAGTDIDVSVAWHLGALRLTVRDQGPALPGQSGAGPSPLCLHGRRLALVAGLSRTFGVLPTGDGGKVVWAVLEAPRSCPPTARVRSGPATRRQDSPIVIGGRGLADLPVRPRSSRPPAADPVRPPQRQDQMLRLVKVLPHIPAK